MGVGWGWRRHSRAVQQSFAQPSTISLHKHSPNPYPAACRAVGKQLAADRAKVTKSKGCVVHSAKSIPVGRIYARVLPGPAAEHF